MLSQDEEVVEFINIASNDNVINAFAMCGLIPKQKFNLQILLHSLCKVVFEPSFNSTI
jgi:hypothetical protein